MVVVRHGRARPYLRTNISLHPVRDAAIISLLDRIGHSTGVVTALNGALAAGYPCTDLTSEVRYIRALLDPDQDEHLMSVLVEQTPRRLLAPRIVDMLRFAVEKGIVS